MTKSVMSAVCLNCGDKWNFTTPQEQSNIFKCGCNPEGTSIVFKGIEIK